MEDGSWTVATGSGEQAQADAAAIVWLRNNAAELLAAYRERDEWKATVTAVNGACARTVRDYARQLDEADEQLAETVALHNKTHRELERLRVVRAEAEQILALWDDSKVPADAWENLRAALAASRETEGSAG